jgi:low affinity Fe/Cu permease
MRDDRRSITPAVRPEAVAPTGERSTLRGRIHGLFGEFASRVAVLVGSPWAFLAAAGTIALWVMSGPAFHYSDSWQLVINTGTTIVTFLMVFLIQNTQNRDSRAVQLKLDELIRATEGAHNAVLDLEELAEMDLDRIRKLYCALAARARRDLEKGLLDTDIPEVRIS